MSKDITLGTFLKAERIERDITVRMMAEHIGVAAGYYCDIESGRRCPIDLVLLDRMIDALHLTDESRSEVYDLAGRGRAIAPPDLTGYINDTQTVRDALRVAKKKASNEDWQRFAYELDRDGQK